MSDAESSPRAGGEKNDRGASLLKPAVITPDTAIWTLISETLSEARFREDEGKGFCNPVIQSHLSGLKIYYFSIEENQRNR